MSDRICRLFRLVYRTCKLVAVSNRDLDKDSCKLSLLVSNGFSLVFPKNMTFEEAQRDVDSYFPKHQCHLARPFQCFELLMTFHYRTG